MADDIAGLLTQREIVLVHFGQQTDVLRVLFKIGYRRKHLRYPELAVGRHGGYFGCFVV